MPDIDRTTLLIIVAVLVCLGVGAWMSVTLAKRRETVWRRFARRHGFRVTHDENHLAVHGRVDRRELQLSVSEDSSDTDLGGVQEIRMELSLGNPWPADVQVHRADGVVGAVERLAETQRVRFDDDPEFTNHCVALGSDESAVRALLTPARRKALAEFVASAPATICGIENAQLFLQDRTMLDDVSKLDGWLSYLRRTADTLA